MAIKDVNRRAGPYWVWINGALLEAKGACTIQPGVMKNDAIVGAASIHGYKQTVQVASIEFAITDRSDLDTIALRNTSNATIIVELNNGKRWLVQDAWYAGEGTMTTEEGEIGARFESAHEIKEIL
jgi:hypothetical protein